MDTHRNVEVIPADQFRKIPLVPMGGVPAPTRGEPRAPWHRRYERAAGLYATMDTCPKLLDALGAGLREWAAMLPQVEQDRSGRHKPANRWGLGAELHKLRTIECVLELDGRTRLADTVRAQALHLHKTATHLDDCYPKLSEDEETAERRLVLTARIQANALADLLGCLKKAMFGAGSRPAAWKRGAISSDPGPRRCRKSSASDTARRAGRLAKIDALKCELVQHIKAAKDHAQTALALNREPKLLPRPTMAELGRRVGLDRYMVCRCLRDGGAHELRLLWQVADDLDCILRYAR